MKNLTCWMLIGIATAIAGGTLISNRILEHRINAVRPLADQQVMQNAELVGKHGYNNGQILFQSNYIEEHHKRIAQYNLFLPYGKIVGMMCAGCVAAGGLLPNQRKRK